MNTKRPLMPYKDEDFLFYNNLDNDTLFDYFSLSPFYDHTCSNEIVKMQTQSAATDEKLREMVGIQYVTSAPELEKIKDLIERCTGTPLVLFKIFRYAYHDFKLLTFYYVIDGVIYEANNEAEIFKVRLSNFLFFCSKALDVFIEKRKFDVFKGFYFENESGVGKNCDCAEIAVLKQIMGLM